MSEIAEMATVWTMPAEDSLSGWQALTWSVGPDHELAVLLVHRRHLRHTPNFAGWIGWLVQPPFDGVLVISKAGQEIERRPVNDIRITAHQLGLLPGSRFVIVGYRPGQPNPRVENVPWEPNATVYSAAGEPESAFFIGDDIETMVTDRRGRLWTIYGDQRLWVNHPESASGLAGWTMEGTVGWTPQQRLPAMPLHGCTATTDGDQVWLIWSAATGDRGAYVSRITPATGAVSSWPYPVGVRRTTRVRAPDGFAVRGNRAVFTMRHHNEPTIELIRAEWNDRAWIVTDQRTVAVPGPVVLRCGQGRDGCLWLRAGDTWLQFSA